MTSCRDAGVRSLADLNVRLETCACDGIVHCGGTSEFAGTDVDRDRFIEISLETT
jgi:hypothetical protein